MKTATLEPESLSGSSKKSSKKGKGAVTGNVSADLGDLSDLLDDQSVIYSLSTASQGDSSLLPTIRTMPSSTEWKTVKSKSSKNTQKKLSFSSDHASVDEVPITGKSKVQAKAKNGLLKNASNVNAASKSNATTTAASARVPTAKAAPPPVAAAVNNAESGADPVKRLRNLRKKLKEIESLKGKDTSTLEKDQLDKLLREDEILEQIEELVKLVDKL